MLMLRNFYLGKVFSETLDTVTIKLICLKFWIQQLQYLVAHRLCRLS